MTDSFNQRKQDILSKPDKSSRAKQGFARHSQDGDTKEYWDEKINDLCEKINNLDNYYTTSSCSGRVVIMQDKDKKEQGLFIKIWHDLVGLSDLKKELMKITSLCSDIDEKQLTKKLDNNLDDNKNNEDVSYKNSVNDKNQFNNSVSLVNNLNKSRVKNERGNVNLKFKQEPPIIHIACKSLEDAESILGKVREAGWKRSGIINLGNRIVVECLSTEKLEFPIVNNGKILVDEDFLKVIVDKSNKNIKKGWEKIEKLEGSL